MSTITKVAQSMMSSSHHFVSFVYPLHLLLASCYAAESHHPDRCYCPLYHRSNYEGDDHNNILRSFSFLIYKDLERVMSVGSIANKLCRAFGSICFLRKSIHMHSCT